MPEPGIEPLIVSPPRPPRYRRRVAYGLGHRGRKSVEVERRSKRSFRRWLRRKVPSDGR